MSGTKENAGMSSQFVLPDSGVRVKLNALDVQITPAKLDFGLGSHQAPVRQAMKQELVLKNPQSHDIRVLFSAAADQMAALKFWVEVKNHSA